MGRQIKNGVDYWNIDTDFFHNKKVRLLRGEFGIKGVYIYLYLLNEIYRDKGYYKKWDYDDCLLASDDMGSSGDCSPQLIAEVVRGCVARSLFDERVFNVFGVLTSREIQRRYLQMIGNNREYIQIIKEYFLLDMSSREDVTEATLGKCTFLQISSEGNIISPTENAISPTENAISPTENTQSKVKESKVKESKEKEIVKKKPDVSVFRPPTREDVREYAKSRNSTVNPDKFYDYFDEGNWIDSKGQPVRNWKQKLITWERLHDDRVQPSTQTTRRAKQPGEYEGADFWD